MAVSKANQRAVNKYVKNNYDRINVTMPKGKKETIQIHAEDRGQSVNAYINGAIDEKMERDTIQEATGDPTRTAEGGTVSLPLDTLKAAQEAAEAAGEALPQFLDRAVATQTEMDKRKGGEANE